MVSKFSEVTPRNFPMSVTGLSDEAREAVNAAFDAMSTWRLRPPRPARKTASKSSRRWLRLPKRWDGGSKSSMPPAHNCRVSQKCRSKTMDQIIDAWEEQIKSPNPMIRSPVGDAVEAKVPAQFQPGWRLAKRRRFPKGGDEPAALLGPICRAVAESVGRRGGVLGQGRQVTGWRRTEPPLTSKAVERVCPGNGSRRVIQK
jgi:hypothetical protein